MTRIITIHNQAGGVMKSTLTMNLGYHLGQRGHSVLLIDMDPQASLTIFMGLEPGDLEQTICDAILDEGLLPIHKDIHHVDLIPSNIDLSAAEMQLVSTIMRELRLKTVLESELEHYDFILIDAPPSLGILSVLSLVASTHVLIPIHTQHKSFKGTELLLNSVAAVRKNANRDLKLAGVIPTIYASRNVQDESTLDAIKEQLSAITTVYPPIPRSTAFPDATQKCLPLSLHDPKHPALRVLEDIANGMEKLS
ncbi:ParA family protein (plasmid) [Acaryochloris sp. CCMEE 5410]|nr:ParA family protein [Acaryochloris sp. CCMEE 5410]